MEGQKSHFYDCLYEYKNNDNLEEIFRKCINEFSFKVFNNFIKLYNDFILDLKSKGSDSDYSLDISSGHFQGPFLSEISKNTYSYCIEQINPDLPLVQITWKDFSHSSLEIDFFQSLDSENSKYRIHIIEDESICPKTKQKLVIVKLKFEEGTITKIRLDVDSDGSIKT